MRFAPRVLLAGGLCLAAPLLAACGGSSGLLTGGQANNLNSQLDQISAAVTSRQCGAAQSAASAFGNAVDNLPASINQTLVGSLRQGATTVGQLALRDCQSQTTTTTTSTPATTTSTSATTSTITSTSTSTSPTSASTITSSTTTAPATTSTTAGTSTTSGSGGAGLGGTGTVGGAGGAGPGGNGGGNAQ